MQSETMCENCGIIVKDVPNPEVAIGLLSIYCFSEVENRDDEWNKVASYSLCRQCQKEIRAKITPLALSSIINH
jgi:hypothetical protein